MAFNDEDRKMLTDVHLNMKDVKPQVKANTKFRWFTLGIAAVFMAFKTNILSLFGKG